MWTGEAVLFDTTISQTKEQSVFEAIHIPLWFTQWKFVFTANFKLICICKIKVTLSPFNGGDIFE